MALMQCTKDGAPVKGKAGNADVEEEGPQEDSGYSAGRLRKLLATSNYLHGFHSFCGGLSNWSIPWAAQGLFLALSSGATPDNVWGTQGHAWNQTRFCHMQGKCLIQHSLCCPNHSSCILPFSGQ